MLIATAPFGLIVMCYGTVVNSIIALIINTYYTGKLINMGFIRQMMDLAFTLFLSLSMFFIVYGLTFVFDSHYLQLIVGMTIGIIYFTIIILIVKPQEILFVKSILNR